MNFIYRFQQIKNFKKIYLRDECNNKENRTPLIPSDIKTLIINGFEVFIQTSNKRIYSDFQYLEMGATITSLHWSDFDNTIIIGLKSLDNLELLEKQKNCIHVYFSHSYLNQVGSDLILDSFAKSSNLLFDLEYFLNNGKRLVTFGYWAGYIGTIFALKQYYNKINNLPDLNNLKFWENLNEIRKFFSDIKLSPDIKIGLIGSNGNCGIGAKNILNSLGLNYIPYNSNSNKNNMENLDIIINCIKLSPCYDEIWFNKNTTFYKYIVISDVSCDYTKPNNPIDIYDEATSWDKPVYSYNDFVDIISIDNLPSMLPKESSDNFSNNLTKLLLDLELDTDKFWEANLGFYIEKINEIIYK
jgi:saccharopine dehydrogenase (NAD+, L-lysine-forming)